MLPKNNNRLVELKDVTLKIGALKILNNINFSIFNSEIHAVIGEHGAGKTSLCMIISGFVEQSLGEFFIDDEYQTHMTPIKAQKRGIEIVTQDNRLFNNFSVADSFFISKHTEKPPAFVHNKDNIREVNRILDQFGFELDPTEKISNLRLSEKVLVNILVHLSKNPRVLILDEALLKLSAEDLEKILKILTELKNEGMAVVYVTHKIDDIFHFADKVSIIRNGEIFLTESIENIDKINLIKLTYTQILSNDPVSKEFYNLLKYNDTILQQLPVHLLVFDNKQKLKIINEEARLFFNVGSKNAGDISLMDLIDNESELAFDLIRIGLYNNDLSIYHNITITKEGREYITNIKINPIFDESYPIGHVLTIEDITEQEKLRQQLIIGEKVASLGLLSAGVAHEINNPLEIIANNIGFIKYQMTNSEVIDALETVEEEIESISQIVGNLVSFSGESIGCGDLLNINEVIQKIFNLVRHSAQEKNIKINFFTDRNSILIKANETEIKQVILNMIKNSFEAITQAGEVQVESKMINCKGKEVAEIVFRDTGIGIPDGNINNIFLPFYSTKESNSKNIGLGLSVSYGIIKKYNGDILVRNLNGSGCEFKIRLPAFESVKIV